MKQTFLVLCIFGFISSLFFVTAAQQKVDTVAIEKNAKVMTQKLDANVQLTQDQKKAIDSLNFQKEELRLLLKTLSVDSEQYTVQYNKRKNIDSQIDAILTEEQKQKLAAVKEGQNNNGNSNDSKSGKE
jgi:hypothetical protein